MAPSEIKKVKKSKKSKTEAAPTLSSFLLGQVDSTDSALDNIFATSKGPALVFNQPTKEKKVKKAKKATEPEPAVEEDAEDEAEVVDVDGDEVLNDADLSEADSNESLDLPSDSDDDDGVEEAYAASRVANRLKAMAAGAKEDDEEEEGDDLEVDDEDDESELDIENLMHESVMPKLRKIKSAEGGNMVPIPAAKLKKAKAISTDTPEERDARTVFLGNVPVACSTSTPMKKALIRHVLTSPTLLGLLPANMPPLKSSSIRFRSLAFASTVFGRKATVDAAPDEVVVEPGGRGRKRARNWRETEDSDVRGQKGGIRVKEAAAVPAKGPDGREKKGALTDGQKRRVAFIRGELNEGKKACNAYIVIENLPASSPIAMPELIKFIVEAIDGSIFETHTLRADHVRPRSSASTLAAAQTLAKPNTNLIDPQVGGASYTVPPLEARRTLFVGGMDFAESEENVRAATEAILVKERGVCPEKGWVERVRIIRDASTGLGKGFGYILFKDAECVDEILALPFGQPLKVSKRKVRLERCKTGVAAARAKAAAATAREAKALPPQTRNTAAAPRDPASFMKNAPKMSNSNSESVHQAKLAQALAKLPAGERKAVKAVDPDRLARRSEKKKNKVLSERWERKNAGDKNGILGRATRAEERNKKEKKRVAAGNKTGKRAKI